jgi:CheY-like chemotaxis protein
MSMHDAPQSVRGSRVEAPPEKPVRRAFPARVRVLIVDDIAENRTVLGMFCDQFGVGHEAVEGGREAVEAARSGRFDVILMDILMPGMDGMAAARAIRALPGPACATPIIAVTTAADPGDALRYRDYGMNDLVAKPIVASRLMQALELAVANARRAGRSRKRVAAEAATARLSA